MTSRPADFDLIRDRAVAKLATLVRIATVSHRDEDAIDVGLFDGFLEELAAQFPLLHQHLDLTRIHTHGLLFHWRGHSAAKPIVLMAHLDVVPVEGDWTHPAFDAVTADGHLWGRGTLDDKGCLVGICEAVERLLAQGLTPAQDVWLSFGCDEEVSGLSAPLAVAELKSRGVRPWLVLDEGGAIAHQAFPGVAPAVGVVGVAEKGLLSLELSATGRGGHASMPTRWGPTTRIARALVRLEKSPFSPHVPEPTLDLFERLSAHLNGPLKILLANARTLRPALAKALVLIGPEPAALVRTTMAVTTLSGSPALNVIAGSATAGINLRISPGESVATTIQHVRKAIRDEQILLTVIDSHEPSPISAWDGEPFALIASTLAADFPDAIVAPYVLMAATDSRHFSEISDHVYRHAPFRMSKQQRESIHSYDERIGLDDFADGVLWYQHLIERLPA